MAYRSIWSILEASWGIRADWNSGYEALPPSMPSCAHNPLPLCLFPLMALCLYPHHGSLTIMLQCNMALRLLMARWLDDNDSHSHCASLSLDDNDSYSHCGMGVFPNSAYPNKETPTPLPPGAPQSSSFYNFPCPVKTDFLKFFL